MNEVEVVKVLELVTLADQLARELLSEARKLGWTVEEAYQVSVMASELISRLQADPRRAAQAMLEARATLRMVSGDLVAN